MDHGMEFTRLGRYHEPLCSGSRFDLTDSSTAVGRFIWKSSRQRGLARLFYARAAGLPESCVHALRSDVGVSSIVLHYVNQNDTKCGEFMEVAPDEKVVRVVAHYSS